MVPSISTGRIRLACFSVATTVAAITFIALPIDGVSAHPIGPGVDPRSVEGASVAQTALGAPPTAAVKRNIGLRANYHGKAAPRDAPAPMNDVSWQSAGLIVLQVFAGALVVFCLAYVMWRTRG